MARRDAPLIEHVAFDGRQEVDDGMGNFVGKFVEALQCRAAFVYLRGTETVIAARLEGRQPIVVRVRRSSKTNQIDHDWQMRDLRDGAWDGDRWTGPVFAVRSIIPTEDRLYLDIAVERGVAT